MILSQGLSPFIALMIFYSAFVNALPIESNSKNAMKNATDQFETSQPKTDLETNKTILLSQQNHRHFELNNTQLHQFLKLPSRSKVVDHNDTKIVAVNSKVKDHFLKNISHTVTAKELQFLNDTIIEMNYTRSGYMCPLLRCKRCPFGYVLDGSSCPVCVCKERPDCPDLSKCKKKCFLSSFMKDIHGCTLCKCKRLRACPLLHCNLNCFYGYQEDEFGCRICKCKEKSKMCPSIANCKKRCYFGNELDSNYCKTCRCKRQKRCPGNMVTVTCHEDPCKKARCRGRPDAICQVDYCNGCYSKFYEKDRLVTCL
eukprot:TCONS_00054382-protein